MKQQFVITSRYTVLQETENTSAVLNRAKLKHVTPLLQYINKPFVYGHSILTASVFVMQICMTILWVTTNHPLMNEIWTWIRSQLTVNDVGSLTGERERPDSGERDRFAG